MTDKDEESNETDNILWLNRRVFLIISTAVAASIASILQLDREVEDGSTAVSQYGYGGTPYVANLADSPTRPPSSNQPTTVVSSPPTQISATVTETIRTTATKTSTPVPTPTATPPPSPTTTPTTAMSATTAEGGSAGENDGSTGGGGDSGGNAEPTPTSTMTTQTSTTFDIDYGHQGYGEHKYGGATT